MDVMIQKNLIQKENSKILNSVRWLLDSYYRALEIEVIFVPRNDKVFLNGHDDKYFCELCKLIQNTSSGKKKCLNTFCKSGEKSSEFGFPYIYQCHAGLIEWSAPFWCGGELLGYFVSGGVLMREPDTSFIKEIEKISKALGVKKLYTKIELCDALAKGGVPAAKLMVHYLGQIGNNQHQVLPTKAFNKNSYPLPRDIIARTLAHMNPNVLPTLLDVLQTNRLFAMREVVDAIGFICFYNNLHTNSQISDALMLCLKNYAHHDVIRWKLVRSFESFDDIDVIHTLMNIEQSDNEQIIRCEARRSLNIINARINSFG